MDTLSPEINSPSPEIPAAEALAGIAAESTARLQAEDAEPIKKKRGRPRKPAPQQAGLSEGGTATVPPSTTPAPSLLPILLPAVKLPFDVAATRRRFAGWKLSDAEAEALAGQAEAIAQAFMPQVSGPYATLAIFGLTLGIIVGSRYIAEADHRAANAKDVTPDTVAETNGGKPTNGTPAEHSTGTPGEALSYFESRRVP